MIKIPAADEAIFSYPTREDDIETLRTSSNGRTLAIMFDLHTREAFAAVWASTSDEVLRTLAKNSNGKPAPYRGVHNELRQAQSAIERDWLSK